MLTLLREIGDGVSVTNLAMEPAAPRAAGMRVEKVRLHALGSYQTYYPPGRGVPSSTLRPREEEGANSQQRSRSRVSSVSFKRTSTLSDGTPEIDAGAARPGVHAALAGLRCGCCALPVVTD